MKKILVILLLLLSPGLAVSADYKRSSFKHWSDLDGDGLDTRQEILIEQSLFHDGAIWACPYTGEVVVDAEKLDIDHIVPLKWAWLHGAKAWGDDLREQFANDPANLLAVRDDANQSKSADGPDKYLPPNLRYASVYIEKFRFVCRKYGLEVKDDELDALQLRYAASFKGVRPQ